MALSKGQIATGISALALSLSVPFIGAWEGKRNDPYKDIAGIPTVCYGETRVPMKKYTDEECLGMLEQAVSDFSQGVVKCTPTLAGHPYQLAAANSLAYNIGLGNYCRSTVAKRFNMGDFKGGCEAFKMWNKAGGRTVQGLVNRRQSEYNLCMTFL